VQFFFFHFVYTQFRGISGYMLSLPSKSKYTVQALKKLFFRNTNFENL